MNYAIQLLKAPLFWVRAGAVFTCIGTLLMADSWDQAAKALAALGTVWGFGKLDTQPEAMKPKEDK